jgi:phosphoribosylaminoimidazolecarboxamide formyltransferase/IMP cyclohydrolase
VAPFDEPAVAIIKHTNPCGLALGTDLVEAYSKALASDPISAFGSIIAVNRPVELCLLESIGKLFVEVIAAPAFSADALEWLGRRKKNCRAVLVEDLSPPALHLRSTRGGLLIQTTDVRKAAPQEWRCVTKVKPSAEQMDDLIFAWAAAKAVKSNAIVIAHNRATVGVGAGQMNRLESSKIAASLAGEKAQGAVLASDAFFPFADGLEAAAACGVSAVAQPGGSIRDDEVIAAADRLGIAMVLTGVRHFKH